MILARIAYDWLVLLATLVVLTLIFITIVIIQTFINSRRPIGKMFSLDLLLTGIAGTISDQFNDLKYIHKTTIDIGAIKESSPQILQAAKEVRIQIKGDGPVKKPIRV